MADETPTKSDSLTASLRASARRRQTQLARAFTSSKASTLSAATSTAAFNSSHPHLNPAAAKWFSGSETREAARDFLAGAGSGLVAKVLEYPLDTVKVLSQTQSAFKGPWDAAVKTVRADGISSLFRGITAPALGGMFENAVVFTGYGWGKHLQGIDDEAEVWHPRWRYAAAGAFAGVFAATMLTPIEVCSSSSFEDS